ncbi:hypothetical protein BDR07DRAFT_1411136 [Suillus spraguei]|nr:hypothetical protein BDR07DRAFT_1411136 [Suillus spraguei]
MILQVGQCVLNANRMAGYPGTALWMHGIVGRCRFSCSFRCVSVRPAPSHQYYPSPGMALSRKRIGRSHVGWFLPRRSFSCCWRVSRLRLSLCGRWLCTNVPRVSIGT